MPRQTTSFESTPASLAEYERLLWIERILASKGVVVPASFTERTPAPKLAQFVERTCAFRLDAWQQHLCARLERLRHEKGQRLLIHAPPQFGKSVIVSQRFPAWMIGCDPTLRVKLACYNIEHATKFSKVLRRLMQGKEYAELFSAMDCRLQKNTLQDEWSTLARGQLADGQSSFKALGLQTGFVGEGADLLVIDDPYSSPQEAMSQTIRDSVWMFWEEAAKVRLTDDTNVVVMFHRYHTDDFAGRLMQEEGLKAEGGQWELLKYSAECTDPANDPIGRKQGEYLSKRRSNDWYALQKKNSVVWEGQFQGEPIRREGEFFKPDFIEVIDALPQSVTYIFCRAWDLAGTEGGGSYTVGILLGRGSDGFWYIVDMVRDQWSSENVETVLLNTAKRDPQGTMIHLPQDPGQAGKGQAKQLVALLAGFYVVAEAVSGQGDKEVRARGSSAQVNAGNVKMLRADWNHDFREELRGFPKTRYKDIVDAFSDSFNALAPVPDENEKIPIAMVSTDSTEEYNPFGMMS
jgi:predicted phage terminase large subunit-like protein